jgi:hypothetical protein
VEAYLTGRKRKAAAGCRSQYVHTDASVVGRFSRLIISEKNSGRSRKQVRLIQSQSAASLTSVDKARTWPLCPKEIISAQILPADI